MLPRERPGPSAPALREWLRVAARALPAPLAAATERWYGLAGVIPGTCLAALESGLDDAAGQVDLSVRALVPEEASALAGPPFAGPALSLLRGWVGSEPLRRRLPALWLELDAARMPWRGGVVPRRVEPLPIARLQPRLPPSWICDRLLPLLLGRAPLPAPRAAVERAVARSGEGVTPVYAFGLGPRGGASLRLELEARGVAPLVDYLDRVAGGDAARRLREIGPVLGDLERVHLALDFDDEVSPRFGVGGSYRRLPHRDGRWRALLARLVDAGVCREGAARDLLAWAGTDSVWSSPGEWPIAPGAVAGRLVRAVSHVKLTVAPDRDPTAKGYRLVVWVPARDRP